MVGSLGNGQYKSINTKWTSRLTKDEESEDTVDDGNVLSDKGLSSTTSGELVGGEHSLEESRNEKSDNSGGVRFTTSLGLNDLNDVENERRVGGDQKETEEERLHGTDAVLCQFLFICFALAEVKKRDYRCG